MDMKKVIFRPIRTLVLLLIVVGITWPVVAQGQTPTSPRPTATQNQVGATQQGQTQTGTGQQQQQQQMGGTGGLGTGTTGVQRGGTQGQQQMSTVRPRRGTATGGMGGARVITGGAGGGGTEMTVGAIPNVTSTGQGPFEPTFQRDLEYGPVPDEGDNITLEGPMQLQEFLQAINLATDWNIIQSEAVNNVQLPFFSIVDTTPRVAMEILKHNDIYFEFNEEDRFLRVTTKQDFLEKQFGKQEHIVFQVQDADVEYIDSVLNSLLSSTGRMITDPRTRRIYVWDMTDNLELMEQTVGELDVPMNRREFMIRYADLADVESVVDALLSDNGSLLTDARTGQLIVWDSPTKLEQMAAAVDWLDVSVESRLYTIENLNVEDMVESLEDMLTERGRIQVDPRYNTLLISDLPSRMDRMEEIIESLDRELETRTWVINYADLDFIAMQIEILIPLEMGEIVINDLAHQVTVTGLPERLDRIDELIGTWDIKRKQVLIEAYIVEVSSEVERQFNVNWTYWDQSGDSPFRMTGGSGFSADSSDPVSFGQLPYNIPLYGAPQLDGAGGVTRPIVRNIDGESVVQRVAGNNLAVTLDYLDRQNQATILASPRVTVQDGEEASFENATRVPYIAGTTFYDSGVTAASSRSSNRVDFIDVGTILSVYPRITDDDNILLDIVAEDSTFTDKEIVANDLRSTIPEKTVRQVQSQLRVASGDTVVLGGLRRDRASERETRTPLLGDIPGFGRLFRYPNKQSSESSLLIFITTTIVDEYTHPETESLAKTEDRMSSQIRRDRKSLMGRIAERISQGQNELSISIGQAGTLYSDGEVLHLEELAETLHDVPSTVRVVIRRHPRAPQEIATEVAELVMEAGLKVEFDNSSAPIVPNLRPTSDLSSETLQPLEPLQPLDPPQDAASVRDAT